jgi:hypothetical protein
MCPGHRRTRLEGSLRPAPPPMLFFQHRVFLKSTYPGSIGIRKGQVFQHFM